MDDTWLRSLMAVTTKPRHDIKPWKRWTKGLRLLSNIEASTRQFALTDQSDSYDDNFCYQLNGDQFAVLSHCLSGHPGYPNLLLHSIKRKSGTLYTSVHTIEPTTRTLPKPPIRDKTLSHHTQGRPLFSLFLSYSSSPQSWYRIQKTRSCHSFTTLHKTCISKASTPFPWLRPPALPSH